MNSLPKSSRLQIVTNYIYSSCFVLTYISSLTSSEPDGENNSEGGKLVGLAIKVVWEEENYYFLYKQYEHSLFKPLMGPYISKKTIIKLGQNIIRYIRKLLIPKRDTCAAIQHFLKFLLLIPYRDTSKISHFQNLRFRPHLA